MLEKLVKRLIREHGIVKLLNGIAANMRKYGPDRCDKALADDLEKAADKYRKAVG